MSQSLRTSTTAGASGSNDISAQTGLTAQHRSAQGSFISAYSKQPRAVWTWLNFLSHTTPMQRYRLVPARRSVAHDYAYWETLPRELGEALRTAFPLARAVRIEERELLTWERLAQAEKRRGFGRNLLLSTGSQPTHKKSGDPKDRRN